MIRLGVNIDHIATIRNARGGRLPDPLRALKILEKAGADGVTAHLREDRRHINDMDIEKLANSTNLPLNLEMAATDEMLQVALKYKPNAVCLVPENRFERTTEGGLDVVLHEKKLAKFIEPLRRAGCEVSLFVEAKKKQIDASSRVGATIIEMHTGKFCDYFDNNDIVESNNELESLKEISTYATEKKLEVHAGHGLTYDTVEEIVKLPHVRELNIGHFIVGEALFLGLETVVRQMKRRINSAFIVN